MRRAIAPARSIRVKVVFILRAPPRTQSASPTYTPLAPRTAWRNSPESEVGREAPSGARSLGPRQIIETMQAVRKPRGQTVRRHALGDPGSGELARGLTLRQCAAEAVLDF